MPAEIFDNYSLVQCLQSSTSDSDAALAMSAEHLSEAAARKETRWAITRRQEVVGGDVHTTIESTYMCVHIRSYGLSSCAEEERTKHTGCIEGG